MKDLLEQNYHKITATLPAHVQLVAVSKTHPAEEILEVYHLGQRLFGENKVQELVAKYETLPKDIRWHLIGHLQTNKVKYIAPFVDMIESVDSGKLLHEIDRQAEKNHRNISVLLQVKIAEEDTKTGMEISETKELFQQYLEGAFPHITVKGLMGMATFTADQEQIRREFSFLKTFYDRLSQTHPLEILSMGMSDDYPVAIDCGANNVRVGSAIFGKRNYPV